MYETEANRQAESLSQLPLDVQVRFQELTDQIVARTVLPWGEHCTECVWPTCYTTCELYSPREDMRCRRFVDGMVRIDHPNSPNAYVLKIRFKRWGKLWSPGNIRLFSNEEAKRRERRDYVVGSFLYGFPMPTAVRKLVNGRRYHFKTTSASGAQPSKTLATSFVIECYNPASKTIEASFTMRPTGGQSKIPLQRLLAFSPGFSRVRIPVTEISPAVLAAAFEIELTPNDIDDGATLYFGLIDFIRESESPSARSSEPVARNTTEKPSEAKKVKCVVWDLDNTLWHGTLVEDGAANLELHRDVADAIKELDRRGILQSIASKNTYEEVWPVVVKFGLADYFLYPQISWGPKSAAVESIAKRLNIGLDTVLFVDDSPFERAQVETSLPSVRVVDSAHASDLPARADCDVPITAEASSRRLLYQQDTVRQQHEEGFDGDYAAFLRDCRLELKLKPLSATNLERVHELTQRTNQMNFSGAKYDRDTLRQIASSEHLETYVLECRDRFGSYGVVGFSIVDCREPRLTDLMFSCRVQSKRVEHAFLTHLFHRYKTGDAKVFWANYRKTPRNAASGRVFADLGMQEIETRDGLTSLSLNLDAMPADEKIVAIDVEKT